MNITTQSNTRSRVWRARWAAIGAAVAVTLGAGGLSLADAAGAGDASALVPVDPVRVLDTRRDLGLVGTFEASTPRDLKVAGSIPVSTGGSEVVVPADATAVSVNITVVRPDAKGFLALRPGGAAGTPETSTVNFEAGINTPNAATVPLSPDGKVQIWVEMPSTTAEAHVLLDIVGYYTGTAHHHDDRYFTETEVTSKLAAKADKSALDAKADTSDLDAKADASNVYTKSEIDADHAELDGDIANSSGVDFLTEPGGNFSAVGPFETFVEMTVDVPVAGYLVVTGSADVRTTTGLSVVCHLNIVGKDYIGARQYNGAAADGAAYSRSVGAAVDPGPQVVRWECLQDGGSVGDAQVYSPSLIAVFSPNRL